MSGGDRPRTVVGAVVVARGRVLAARRRTPAELAGRWEFPGGKVEPGEDPRAALRRELLEELALPVRVGAELVGPAGPWPISARYELRLFLASAEGPAEPQPGADHDRVVWQEPDRLAELDWLPSDRAALDAIRARLAGAPADAAAAAAMPPCEPEQPPGDPVRG